MSKAKNIINFIEQESKATRESAVSGPRDEDVARFIFNALAGEREVAGVKVKVETMGLRKAPLNIEADIPLQGKMYHIEASIPYTALRITLVE